jgi:hypothetical protein
MNGYTQGSGLSLNGAWNGGATDGLLDDAWDKVTDEVTTFGQGALAQANRQKSSLIDDLSERVAQSKGGQQLKTDVQSAARDEVKTEIRTLVLPAVLGALALGGIAVYFVTRRK